MATYGDFEDFLTDPDVEVVKKNNTRTSVCFEVRQPELGSTAAIRRLQKDAP